MPAWASVNDTHESPSNAVDGDFDTYAYIVYVVNGVHEAFLAVDLTYTVTVQMVVAKTLIRHGGGKCLIWYISGHACVNRSIGRI